MSVIGINGKIGSGKDTVGNIIQYLTAEDTGKFCLNRIYSGKSIEGHHNSDWKIKKYAGKLKQTASLLTGIPVEMFEDQEFKKTALGPQWNYNDIIGYGHHNVPVYGESEQEMLVRELLQKLGTEAMRDGLHTNVWVNALFADYKSKRELLQADGTWIESDKGEVDFAVSIKYPNWIITDMRFPNELESVVERGGVTIRVIRDYALRGGPEDPKNIHPSETALDNAKFDYEIINDGTIEDLVEKVREILIKENII